MTRLSLQSGCNVRSRTLAFRDLWLSKEKSLDEAKQTAPMTGCGSSLWMAPEILLGKTYNEKVDVFAYAMCLVELVDQVCALSSYADRHHEQMGD
jgi:serine/threonine protein kinase